jgi:arabinofuranosyltransferase
MKSLNRTSLVLLTTFALLTLVLLLSAWLCDDAYITFRTVENLVDGHGPRWNVLERVQSYTHPLWMFLLAGLRLVSGEIYFTSIIFSLVLTMITAWLLSRSFSAVTAPLAVLALLLSKAFVDYSTSGLENPLTHLLLVLVIGQWWKLEKEKRGPAEVLRFYLLACLCLLTRQDMVVLLAPVLGQVFWTNRGRAGLRALAIGLSPLIVWEIFSVIYYGFPVPNTAYAKLGAGLSLGAYLGQGMTYLRLSLVNDPVTAVVLVLALIASAMNRTRNGLLALGIVLYMGYVVRIGGDFMVGRYLTAPFVVSLMVLARSGWVAGVAAASWRRSAVVAASLIVFGFLGSQPTLLSGPDYGKGESHLLGDTGVADERAYFYRSTGLLRSDRGEFNVDHPWATQGRRFRQAGLSPIVCRTIGFNGFFAGPEVHVIDLMGLSDPLLARLPAPVGEDWRIGHLQRELPAGYQGSVVEDRSGVKDPGVGELDRKLRLVTRGDLFSGERWRVIFGLNFGGGG